MAIPNPTAKVENIGPREAQQMLAQMGNNRSLSRSRVDSLAEGIDRGEWKLNGETVIIDADGNVIDGQHRLHAIIKSKRSVPVVVVRGVRPDAIDTIDTGKSRSLINVLQLTGIGYAGRVGPVVSLILVSRKFNTFNLAGHQTRTIQEAEALLQDEPEIIGAVQKVDLWMTRSGIGRQAVVAALFYMASLVDESDADAFFQAVAYGEGLVASDPAYMIRSRMILDRTSRAKLTNQELAALIIKAWNAYRKGTKIKKIGWRASDGFPVMA